MELSRVTERATKVSYAITCPSPCSVCTPVSPCRSYTCRPRCSKLPRFPNPALWCMLACSLLLVSQRRIDSHASCTRLPMPHVGTRVLYAIANRLSRRAHSPALLPNSIPSPPTPPICDAARADAYVRSSRVRPVSVVLCGPIRGSDFGGELRRDRRAQARSTVPSESRRGARDSIFSPTCFLRERREPSRVSLCSISISSDDTCAGRTQNGTSTRGTPR